jgi:hypothetical protein
MYNRKLGTLAAILAMAAGGSALASSAQASLTPVQIGTAVVDNDPISVLGDPEVTFVDGNVAFNWGNGSTGSRITGKLHVVNGDSARYRLKVTSRDRAGTSLGSTYDSLAGHPVHTDDPKDFTVDMAGTSAPFVDRVEVSVQKQGTGGWVTKGTVPTTLTLHDDSVKVLGDGIDLGGSTYSAGAPTTSATMDYDLGDDGKMTANYSGYLHFENFSRCGRVVLRLLSPFGLPPTEIKGAQHCPADNGYHRGTQDILTAGPTSGSTSIEVALQSKTGGVWQDVNTQTVGIAE